MKYSGNLYYISAIDRLLDSSLNQADFSLYKNVNREECLKSIARNLSNILNTRSQTSAEIYDSAELTVLDFGMPDFGYYSPENIDDKMLLAKRIKKAITAFEPRLSDISVEFDFDMPDEKSLAFVVKAYLKLGGHPYEVSFLTKKELTEGNWGIYESIGK